MNRLVEIRITDAKENLNRVRYTLDNAIRRRREAQSLKEGIEKFVALDLSLDKLKTLISRCEAVRPDSQGITRPLLMRSVVEDADKAVSVLEKELKDVQVSAAELAKKVFSGDELKRHVAETNELLAEKNRLLDDILLQAPNLQPKEVLRRIENANPLWGKHVERLAGVILRDEGFDAGLCVLADSLVRDCENHPPFTVPKTLHILGRDHTVQLTDSKFTAYFRFPTWSVWGLPLTALEFWDTCRKTTHQDLLWPQHFGKIVNAEKVWEKPFVQVCLADTFSTFVIGPSYAFACILLVLDINSPQDRIRAETIFATLDYLAAGNPWYSFASQLRDCWANAIPPQSGAQTTQLSSTVANSNPPYPMVDPGLIDEVGQMRGALLQFIPVQMRYDVERWSVITKDLGELLECPQDEWLRRLKDFSQSLGEVDLRHILHGGWLRRWESSKHEGKQIKTIEERVVKLCWEVASRRSSASSSADDDNGPS